MLYIEIVKRINPKASPHKENIFFSLYFYIYMR